MINNLLQKKYFWIFPLFISLAWTFILYFSVLSFDFVDWDDNAYVYQNQDIIEISVHSLQKFFSTFYLGMYQPLTMLSFAVDYHFFGLSAPAFHGINLLIHLLNVCLVFLFIRKLTDNIAGAFIVSLFFGIHPMHVESVAWISERKDVLYSFFYLLGLISYLKFLKSRESRFWIAALSLFILSLLSKSAAVTFPLILFCLHFYIQKETFQPKKVIASTWPFFLLSLVFGILSIFSQKSFGSADISQAHYNQINRLFIAGYAYFSYIIYVFFPSVFAAVHPFPLDAGYILPSVYYVFSVFSLIVFFLVFWYFRYGQKNPLYYNLMFGFLFFTCTIFLILYNPASKAVFADRYTYLPYIGLFFMVFFLFDHLLHVLPRYTTHIRLSIVGVLIFLSIFYSVQAGSFISNWKDSESLWNATTENKPSSIAYFSRAIVKKDKGDINGAIRDYEKAISLNEHFFQAYTNIAAISIEQLNYSSALIYLNKVVSLNNSFSEGYYNRGLVYSKLDKIQQSIDEFSSAINYNSSYQLAYHARANAYASINKFSEAYNDVSQCLRMNPNDYHSLTLRGYLLFKSNQLDDALIDLNLAISIEPSFAVAYNNRALVYKSLYNYPQALNDLNKAISIDSQFFNAIYNRAKLFLDMNQPEKACKDLVVAYKGGIADAGLLIEEFCR